MGIIELGHTGVYVENLERMREFYSGVLGLTVTDEVPGRVVFLSSRPKVHHHEFVLVSGRTAPRDVKMVNQISWVVDSLESLQGFYRALVKDEAEIDEVVTHGNAIGVYFRDPEGTRTEVFWVTGLDVPQPFRVAIGIEGTSEEILEENDRLIAAGLPDSSQPVPAT